MGHKVTVAKCLRLAEVGHCATRMADFTTRFTKPFILAEFASGAREHLLFPRPCLSVTICTPILRNTISNARVHVEGTTREVWLSSTVAIEPCSGGLMNNANGMARVADLQTTLTDTCVAIEGWARVTLPPVLRNETFSREHNGALMGQDTVPWRIIFGC